MNPTDIAVLRSAVRQHGSGSRDRRFLYRALCVLLIIEGNRPSVVADWLGEHARTLERWRKRFTDGGVAGLMDDSSPGRPPKLSSHDLRQLHSDLQQSPQALGLEDRKWRGKTLQQHLLAQFGVEFSLRQCQRLLKRQRANQGGSNFKAGPAHGYTSSAECAAGE